MKKILGIGSRIDHSEYGKGVVTNVTSKMYWVTFIENGLETIDVDADFEVIHAAEDEVDSVSFYEVESSLKEILKKWSDVSEIVPIADKWRGGTMIFRPKDANLSDKEIPINPKFDIIAFSVSFENDYFNVLELLHNAGIPLRSNKREDPHPLVIAGGVPDRSRIVIGV